MRYLMLAASAVFFVNVAVAEQGSELFDKASGVAVTLPEDWKFFVDRESLRAASEDEQALVIMRLTEEPFEQELLRLEEVGKLLFEDVEVDEALILVGDDRGALEGAVVMRGRAVHRKDGKPVEFAAMLVKSGFKGEMIFGAWKDPKYAQVVRNIVDSVHVRRPEMESGLQLTDKKTGATITIPEEWSAYAYRTGLFAFNPDRRAMTLIVMSDDDFQETRQQARAILAEKIFTDIRIGRFSAFTVMNKQGFGQVVAATGTARGRLDGEPAEFIAIVAEQPEQDSGVLVIGAWKDEEHKNVVYKTLESLRVKK